MDDTMMTAPAALGFHAGRGEIGQPNVALHVRAHDFVEDFVREACCRPVIGVDGGVADERVDAAPCLERAFHKGFDFRLARDVAGDDDRLSTCLADASGDDLTRLGLAGGNHDFRAKARHMLGDRLANAARRACDECDLTAEVERIFRWHRRLPGSSASATEARRAGFVNASTLS
jgi:hypothetical protein